MVQWLRLRAPNAGGRGSIPGQGTKIPHAATKSPHATTKSPHAATKTWSSQTKKNKRNNLRVTTGGQLELK